MTFIFAILFPLTVAFAADQDTFEKTYPRDNCFCQIGTKRIELMVKGDNSHTEPKERMWGEHVFAREDDGAPTILPVTSESGLYRLFQGTPSSCTKAVGSMIDGKFAVLFQKHNSPHKHRLVIQYFDPKTQKPLETLHTPLLADKAMVKNDTIIFRTHPPERQDIQMGKVTIQTKKYLFQDHRFPVWMSLSKSGIVVEPELTYEEFLYKSYFKTSEEFRQVAGWNDANKSFNNTTLYVAINHETKSKCIFMTSGKKTLTGEESWICQ